MAACVKILQELNVQVEKHTEKLCYLEEQREKTGDRTSERGTARKKEEVTKAMPRVHRKSPQAPEHE